MCSTNQRTEHTFQVRSTTPRGMISYFPPILHRLRPYPTTAPTTDPPRAHPGPASRRCRLRAARSYLSVCRARRGGCAARGGGGPPCSRCVSRGPRRRLRASAPP
ncbi:hypothetical protein PsYK624_100530 [Phanerochaete sordida]|uniref:Uncharacterized protein n=1 Tax=Phanerochaete sordida TaxID=48140 RepID=A0A9P3GHU9_9APHY|nr:hypothetical protein PsYK624_100530 [Phanerochaete sordida]